MGVAGVVSGGRRAPRLRHDERLAPYLTRVGRFRRIDPTATGGIAWVRLLGVLWWAALLEESFRRGRKAAAAVPVIDDRAADAR